MQLIEINAVGFETSQAIFSQFNYEFSDCPGPRSSTARDFVAIITSSRQFCRAVPFIL